MAGQSGSPDAAPNDSVPSVNALMAGQSGSPGRWSLDRPAGKLAQPA